MRALTQIYHRLFYTGSLGGATRGRSPVHRRADMQRHTVEFHSHTYRPLIGSPIHRTYMSLECGRNLEYLQGIHADTGGGANSTQKGPEPAKSQTQDWLAVRQQCSSIHRHAVISTKWTDIPEVMPQAWLKIEVPEFWMAKHKIETLVSCHL